MGFNIAVVSWQLKKITQICLRFFADARLQKINRYFPFPLCHSISSSLTEQKLKEYAKSLI